MRLLPPDTFTVFIGTDDDNQHQGKEIRMYGLRGDDTLLSIQDGEFSFSVAAWGGRGTDILGGGSADDALYGGRGNDTLNGGEGNDLLKGGKGRDTFEFDLGFRLAPGFDTIADFNPKQDKIIVNGADAAYDAATGVLSADTGSKLVALAQLPAGLHLDV